LSFNFSSWGATIPITETDFPCATRYIRTLRGGSQPILVEASDGQLYVAKFTNNLQGPNLPFNESMGSELYRSCGLSVPAWTPLLIADSFLDHNPDCWLQTPVGSLRPDPGLCFGSRFLGGTGVRLLEVLPRTSFARIRNQSEFGLAWVVDICAGHADNRQALFQEDADGWLNAYFVDHGHLFGGPKGDCRRHFITSRYLDPRIYKGLSLQCLQSCYKVAGSLDVSYLEQRIYELPEKWKTQTALRGFAECLSRLSNPSLVQSVIETIVDAQERFNGRESSHDHGGRKPPVPVLRAGVQAQGLAQRIFGNGASYSTCSQG